MNWKKKIIMQQISDFTKRLGLGKVAYLELTSKESFLGLAGKKIEITFSDNPLKYRSQTLVLFLKREDNITEYLEFTLIEGITLQLSKYVIELIVGECTSKQVIDIGENLITLELDFKCFTKSNLTNPAIPNFNSFAVSALELMPNSIHPVVGHLSRIIPNAEIQSHFNNALIKNLLDYMKK